VQQSPSNPDTLSLKLATSVIKYCDLDTAIYILSRGLEILCNNLASDLKLEDARQKALAAANYAKICRQFAEEAREKQEQVNRVN
jgi:hypothetical protein